MIRVAKCSCGLPFKALPFSVRTIARYCEHCDRGCPRQHIQPCQFSPCPLHRTTACPQPCAPGCKNPDHLCDLCRNARVPR